MFGDYPSSMRTRVGDRLPRFSKVQSTLLKGSLDFVGINHYTTWYAWHNSTSIIGVLLNDYERISDGCVMETHLHVSISLFTKELVA